MQPASDVSSFLQYGSFGLLAALVVWTLWKGIPNLLSTHKETIQSLVNEFKSESKECRDERIALAASNALEREKDREMRRQLYVYFSGKPGPSPEGTAEMPALPKGA